MSKVAGGPGRTVRKYTTAGCGNCNPQGWIEDQDGKPVRRCPSCHPAATPALDSPPRLVGLPSPDETDRPDRTGTGPVARQIRLTRASQIRMRPVRWLWDERIPSGALTVLPGREGIGKSLTLAWLASQLTQGTLPGKHFGVPRAVIYAAAEDSWSHTIVPRLYAAGADLDLVYRVDVEQAGTVGQLILPRDCDGLAEEIRALDVVLLAADPLLSLISAGIDTHKDRELRTALEPLVRVADQTDCAIVGLAHFNKSASSDALTLITGSRAFSAVARAVLAIARDTQTDDGSCVLSQAKNNLGRLDVPSLRYVVRTAEVPTDEGPAHVGVLEFTGESARSVSDILADGAADPMERSERDEAAEWIVTYLADHGGEARFADILKAARAEGIAERTLKRARQRAGATSVRTGFPAVSVWRLQLAGTPSPVNDEKPVGPAGPPPADGPQPGPTGPTGVAQQRPRPDNGQEPT
ncbi:ATP-binding protein [Spirillospora albida]|uniref:AAA family ATPase n=1 Tax=Spirillospora albida TaxID=58123 RepID=UPI000A023C59|nr:AAA family ATPase [Spirillospora albida]